MLTDSVSAPPPILIELNQTPTTCFGDADGELSVTVTSGGVEPFVYSIGGGAFGTDSLFVGLESDRYQIAVMDADGCMADGEIFVEQPFELIVDLGPDETILLGDSTDLRPQVNTTAGLSYVWTTDSDISCLDCPNPSVRPFDDALYELLIVDSSGCTASDFIEIMVDKDRNVFIPNAFTPNGDGVNDIFLVFTNSTVVGIQNFVIYNRWGEQMYAQNSLRANDPTAGWDGTFKGQMMDPGVFVYYLEIIYVDGVIEPFKGDVTLVR
ncbi:MAG: gliding motility-associated C-terminal domain-containing protein [Bacteroidota bacterium]